MNRRDALKSLMALPAVARVASVDVKPTDVIVIEGAHELNNEEARMIHQHAERVWPNQKVVVLSGGLTALSRFAGGLCITQPGVHTYA